MTNPLKQQTALRIKELSARVGKLESDLAIAEALIAVAWQIAADADWSTGRDVDDRAPSFLSDWQRGLVAGQASMRDAILSLTPASAIAVLAERDAAMRGEGRKEVLTEIMKIPQRIEKLGGQNYAYVLLDEIAALAVWEEANG